MPDPAAPSNDNLESDLLAGLNPAQREAVTAGDGACLVVAGAGTGKTRTLVFRVAHLISQGVAPESILLLTFTRRASQEMLRRAASLVDERCRRVAGGTFHSFANGVLRRHARRLGYEPGFTILDRSDAADLMGVLRTEGGFDRSERRFPRKDTLVDLLSKGVNTGRPLEELVEEAYPQFLDDLDAVRQLGERYRVRKKEQNVMDYDDLLVNLRDLLKEHDAVRRKLGDSFRHILIDEYQDTNRLQAHIGALLASVHGNIMVVGDDAQSIYSFRGADFRNILDFPKIFPGARTVLLEQNYRSTQPILDLGNAVLAGARERYEKNLFTRQEGELKPYFVRTADDFSQAELICREVLALREEGVPLNAMAVLCRAAWHTNNLELELANRNIPFRKFGGQRLVESAHIKDLCALLKLTVNPKDAPAWFRFLQLFEGIGPRTAQQVASAVIDGGGDIAALTAPELARRRYGTALARLAAALDVLSGDELSLAEKMESAVGYYGQVARTRYDDIVRRMKDLESLQVIATRYRDLESFLTDLAIDPPELARPGASRDSEDEFLTLSTVHSAKGLEWHTVFLIQLTEGNLPSRRSLDDPAGREEERRLFYVAVTRAKRRLYLIKPEQLPGRGGYGALAETSSFLAELDLPRLVEESTYKVEEDWSDEGGGGESSGGESGGGDRALLDNIESYFN